jgi:hypothetical protein
MPLILTNSQNISTFVTFRILMTKKILVYVIALALIWNSVILIENDFNLKNMKYF